jgi:hypothetical protein
MEPDALYKYELISRLDSSISCFPKFDLANIVSTYLYDPLEFNIESVAVEKRQNLLVQQNTVTVTEFSEPLIKILSKQSLATCPDFSFSVITHTHTRFAVCIERFNSHCFVVCFMGLIPKSIVTFKLEFKDNIPFCYWYVTLPDGKWGLLCETKICTNTLRHCSSCIKLLKGDTSVLCDYYPAIFIGFVPQSISFTQNPEFPSESKMDNEACSKTSNVINVKVGDHQKDVSCGPGCLVKI